MRKNGQYVGVDEKYIPEEEKYVDNEINEEIKDSINDGLRSINNYATNKDNQEKFKKNAKKGLKFLKGYWIGSVVVRVLIFLVAITVIAFTMVKMVNMWKSKNEQEKVDSQFEEMFDNFNSQIYSNK